jgi:hypothetical protein
VTFDGEIVVRSRKSGLAVLLSGGFVLASLLGIAMGIDVDVNPWGTFGVLGMYAAYPMVIALAMHLLWIGAKRQRVTLEPTSTKSVRANGAVLRSRLVSAKIIPQPRDGVIVELRRRLDPYPARVALLTDPHARAFVRELGLDAREGLTRFHVPLTGVALVASWMAAVLVGITAIALLKAFALFLLPLGIWMATASRRTVTIGTDGILIEGYWRRRFVPYSSVEFLEREHSGPTWRPMVSRGFFLVLHSGERIYLHTMHERLRDGMFEGDYLFDAAVAHHRAAVHDAPNATVALSRGGRSAAEWIRELRTAREPRYRVAAIPDEEIYSVLVDPSADKSARAGAAVCLATAGDEARAKVRIAAEDVAAPELRAAIDAALSDDEEALARSLDALV